MAATDHPDAPGAAEDTRPGSTYLAGVAGAMKTTGDTDKNGAKNETPSEKTAAHGRDRPDEGTPAPRPPNDNERASAAKANPLRTPADAKDAEAKGAEAKGVEREGGPDEPTQDDSGKQPASTSNARASGAPELRISASMLSAQPSAAEKPKPNSLPSAKPSKYRRRTKDPVAPVEPGINPLSWLWPRANSRRGARLASRYGLVGLIVSLLWVLLEIRADTIDQLIKFSSSATAVAAVIGTIALLTLVVVGYYYHSRVAALVSLSGVVALVVFQHHTGDVPALRIVGQATVIYLLLHGVHGTIAYHIFGRRKRRKGSAYRYKND